MIPQKKKTPEEIAKLRESLGLPGAGAEPEAVPEAPPAAVAPPTEPVAPLSPQPIARPVVTPVAAPVPEIPLPSPEPRPPVEAKPVRSLRKSERVPLTKPVPAAVPANPQSSLPAQRRTEIELNQMRRAEAFGNRQPPPATHLLAITANPFIVGLGYVFAFASALLPFADWQYWFPAPFALTASLAGLALAIAAFIFLKKKRSVHNACFIAIIAFFVLVFSALYYFPHLRNAP